MAYLIIFLIAALVSSIGFKKFIYFISIGYGFSIAMCAVMTMSIFWQQLSLPTVIFGTLLFAYGMRLGIYLLAREMRSASYRKVLSENTKEGGYPLGVTLAIWISCALLYLAQVSPLVFRLSNISNGMAVSDTWVWIGVAVMVLGVALESAADAQKAAAKKKNPDRFVNTGLYRMVRCPNYFGEMVTWTGCLLTCIGASCSVWQWIVAAVGYITIVYIMFSGARRLEIRQEKNYGNDPEYREYAKKTPILVPLLPIYSVARYAWLRG